MLDAIRAPRVADAIADRLEGTILEGVLRPSLREALETLARRGLLVTGKPETREMGGEAARAQDG